MQVDMQHLRFQQPTGDLEALAGRAARLDGAAGRGDDVLDDREAETRAARRTRGVGAVEPLEQPFEIASVTPAPSSATGAAPSLVDARTSVTVHVLPAPA